MGAFLETLDQFRAGVLKSTLRFDFARKIFVSKALRLLFFVSLSLGLNFILALSVPIVLLAFGPLLFGVTHLFASFRFVPKALSEDPRTHRPLTQALTVLVLSIGCFRIFQTKLSGLIYIPAITNNLEWIVLGLTLVILTFVLKNASRVIAPTLILFIPLAAAAWHSPLLTASFLMIAHNFVPFLYWLKLAKRPTAKKQELWVAASMLATFILLNGAILSGLTDPLLKYFVTLLPDIGIQLNAVAIAQQVFPTTTDFSFLERGLVMFAFGQAVHYFLWIKVIPEAALQQEVPLTFRQSKKSFLQDFGPRIATFAALSVVGFSALLFYFPVEVLRDIYIAGVAAHGYAELAGLPFLLRPQASSSSVSNHNNEVRAHGQ